MRKIQKLASTITAYKNCIESKNKEWEEKWEEEIEEIIDSFPHGSGLDGKWKIDFEKCNRDKVVLKMEFHSMNENGYYDGWISFTVIVTPSFLGDFDLDIKGNFGRKQDIKDYLYDILQWNFSTLNY